MNLSKTPILLILLTVLTTPGCRNSQYDACRGYGDCTASKNGLIFGGSEAERKLAVDELNSAASTFLQWTGHEAPVGLVLLRNSLNVPALRGGYKPWILYFDEAETKCIENALPKAINNPEGIHLAPANGGVAAYDKGDLAHEICHKYVERISAGMEAKQPVPDLVNEAAAISCEPRSGRDRQIAALIIHGAEFFSSEGLYSVRNPLAVDPRLLVRAGVPIEDGKPHTVTFTIDNHAALSQNLANYYGRAGILQEYLRQNHCNGLGAIGSLLQSSSHGESFKDWLLSESASRCIPKDRLEFDRAINNLLKKLK